MQWIKGIPDDIEVLVRDYDTDEENEDTKKDEDGNIYVESSWTKG